MKPTPLARPGRRRGRWPTGTTRPRLFQVLVARSNCGLTESHRPAALQRGWELIRSSSFIQEYRKGDIAITLRYRQSGAILHAEWFREGTRRELDPQYPNKREAIIAWLDEEGAASQA